MRKVDVSKKPGLSSTMSLVSSARVLKTPQSNFEIVTRPRLEGALPGQRGPKVGCGSVYVTL